MDITNIVKNLGVSDSEARIYLACVELGESPVSKIAHRARINRVSAYDILEKLMQRGMINSSVRQGIRHFDATDPQIISSDFSARANDFKKALPDLKRLRGEAIHPRIRYFEGIAGLKAIYEDTLKSRTEILNFCNSGEVRKHWPNYDEEYVAKRAKKRIFLRGIAPSDAFGISMQSRDKTAFREIRLVPQNEFTFTNEINIYDDKVAIISFQDEPLIGMIIESQSIADTQRDIFKMAWEFAGKTR